MTPFSSSRVVPSSSEKKKPRVWCKWVNNAEQMAFINAIREVLDKDPIPWSQPPVKEYSGIRVYSNGGGRHSSMAKENWFTYEPIG